MFTYRQALDETAATIRMRARLYRDLVVTVVLMGVLIVVLAIVLSAWRVLITAACAVPVCGLFLVRDAQLLVRWRSSMLAAWVTRDLDFAALFVALRALPVLPRGTLEVTAMKVRPGAGIWDAMGKLLYYSDGTADMGWSENPDHLYSLENRARPGSGLEGNVLRTLARRDAMTYKVLETSEVHIPRGAFEYLVINNRGDKCLASWLDQTRWGYVVLELPTMQQLPGGPYYPTATLAPPAFAPDDSCVVSCNFYRSGWWTDDVDEYWKSASAGGFRKMATIIVDNLSSDKPTQHDVFARLPAGWIPENPSASEWDMIWGPEFISKREFNIWLPDNSVETLSLPLEQRIEISRPMSITSSPQ